MKGRRNELTRRLIRSIVAVDEVTGCWNCRDCNSYGYGQVKVNYKTWRAHRASWLVFKGPIPKGLYVLHKCDNRACCNPRHLYLGNNIQNVRDMYLRGRARPVRGSSHGNSKLKEKDIARIIHLVKTEKYAQSRVADLYEVDVSVINRAVNGKTWSHLNLVPGATPRHPRKYAERRAS